MSKSLGNVVDALEMLNNGSVDLLRYYIMWKSSPVDALSLDTKEMTGRPYQVLNTLYHLHVYLQQNGEQDGFDPTQAHGRSGRRGGSCSPRSTAGSSTTCEQAVASVERGLRDGQVQRSLQGARAPDRRGREPGLRADGEERALERHPQGEGEAAGDIRGPGARALDPRHAPAPRLALPHRVPLPGGLRGGAWKRPAPPRGAPRLALPKSAKAESEAVEFALDGGGRVQLREGEGEAEEEVAAQEHGGLRPSREGREDEAGRRS